MLIGTPFGFSPAILLAYRSYRPNLLIVVCISYYSFLRSHFLRDCPPRYLSNKGAENAHLPKILCLYAIGMQKIRISMTFVSVSLPHRVDGWR